MGPSRSSAPKSYYHLELLRSDLARRKAVNSRYSMRAYAAKLGCDPSAICRIFQGKQELSMALSKKIIRKLSIDAEEKRRFLKSIVEQHGDIAAAELAKIVNAKDLEPPTYQLPPDVYPRVNDPTVLSILECHALSEPVDAERIARHLGTSVDSVKGAIELLAEVGLLVRDEGGNYRKAAAQFRADPNSTPKANASYYEKLIAKTEQALRVNPPETQMMNGLSMLVDPKRLPLARKLVQSFVNDLCDLLEQGDRTHVYQLGFQLFPFGGPARL